MNKITIAALTMLTLGATQAEYTLKIPLEQNQGGNLPNGSIIIKKHIEITKWEPYIAEYSEWVNQGSVYNCNWLPSTDNFYIEEHVTQTSNDCKQEQIRSVLLREINSSGEIRTVGSPFYETQEVTIGRSTRFERGTGTSWGLFARHYFPNKYNHYIIPDFNNLDWSNSSIRMLPQEFYPRVIINNINLSNNRIEIITSLISLREVNFLDLSGNPLHSLFGIENIIIGSEIRISPSYSGNKINSQSRFCMLNNASKFPAGYAQKTQLCQP